MMKIVSKFEFPETKEEARDWKPIVRYLALHSQVLVVAQTRIEGKWSAYCCPVAGQSHRNECQHVLKYGTKLSEEYARALFPQFTDLPYHF